MMLAVDIVVMAVDHVRHHRKGREMAGQRRQHQRHHLVAVLAGIGLRPGDGGDVIVEVRAALREMGQIAVGELDKPAFHVAPGQLDEIGADGVADASAARVQNDPHLADFIR